MNRIARRLPAGVLLCLTTLFGACDSAPPERGENGETAEDAAAGPDAAPYELFAGRAQDEGTFSSYTRNAHYVRMADGVELAVTVYLPTDGPGVSGFPVLLWYMPGHRE